MRYYRYCSDYESPHTRQNYGIFICVWHLIRDQKVTAEEERADWDARQWFEENLPIPPCYREGNPDKAITWFKAQAMEGSIVHELGFYRDLAKKYGVAIDLVISEFPGDIIYEDEHQIAAIPNKTS